MDEVTAISIMAPAEMSSDIEQFAKDNKEKVRIEPAAPGEKGARDLGFEPITTTIVTAWVLKFIGTTASGLAGKLIIDKIYKKMQSTEPGKPAEVQIAFPNGYTLTIRGADKMDPKELERIIEENLRT